jgi:SAM-dependent methyltransferase
MKETFFTDIPPVSDELIERVIRHREVELQGVVKVDLTKLARDYLNLNRARELFRRFANLLPRENGKLLEIGSGFGSLIAYSLKWEGIEAYGIEPDQKRVEICRDLLEEFNLPTDRISRSVGEAIPLPSNSVDLICSFTVFEHVQNPQRVLEESVRVLKPGGHLYFSFPNYGSWWEGHYAILWIPYLPKWVAKLYVRLLGRNPAFLDHLQLINYRNLKQWIEELDEKVETLGLGQDIWEKRLRTLAFSEWAQLGRLKKWTGILHRLGLIEILIRVGRRLHWETPFILVLRKPLLDN